MIRISWIVPALVAILLFIASCDSSSGTGVGGSGFLYRIETLPVDGITYRAKVDDGYLFTMNDEYGLMVFDVQLSSYPNLLGYYSNVASDFVVSGDYAYIAGDGFEIVDLTRLADIEQVTHYHGINATDVIVRGDYAYVSDANYGLRILDISTPYYIFEVGSYFWGFETTEIAMKWPYVLGIYDSGMWIMRVDDPDHISLVADYGIFDSNALDIYGDYAYIAGESLVTVLNISDIDEPREIGYYSLFSPSYDVIATSSKLFVAAGMNGVIALDVSTPSAPALIDSYYTGNNAWSLDIEFDIIYVACDFGIEVLRIGY